MARDFDGTDDWVSQSSTVDAWTTGISLAMWVYPDSIADYQYFLNFEASGVAQAAFWMGSQRITWAWPNATSGNRAVQASTNGTNGFTTGVWQHICVTQPINCTVSTDIHCYLNGVNVDDIHSGTDNPTKSLDSFVIAGRTADNLRNFNGKMAEVACWEHELAPSEVAALAAGYSVPSVHPANLAFYHPFVRSLQDMASGGTLTTVGTSVYPHPPIIRPTAPQVLQFPKRGKIWINDASTKDGGEVLQTHPGTGWSDTSIIIPQVVDTTGLTGQLYLGIERPDGEVTWQAITVKNFAITSVSSDDILPRTETDWVIAGTDFGVR